MPLFQKLLNNGYLGYLGSKLKSTYWFDKGLTNVDKIMPIQAFL